MAEQKLHIKPTKAELEEGIKKATEEVEKELEVKEEIPKEDTPTPPSSEPEKETPSEPPPSKKKKEEKPEIDYKKQYIASTREAKVLYSKDKAMNQAIEQANALHEPTDKEMIASIPDWDVLSDFEKRLAKDTELNKRQMKVLHQASQAGKPIAEWYDKVDKFIEDPKTLIANPDLEGKQEEFRMFASKETRRGVDFEDLVKAFLYDIGQEEAKKPKNKDEMFPRGSGGPSTKEESGNKISTEEMTRIRESNYKLYKEKLKQIKAGTLELEPIE
jgi:hypothetical protein